MSRPTFTFSKDAWLTQRVVVHTVGRLAQDSPMACNRIVWMARYSNYSVVCDVWEHLFEWRVNVVFKSHYFQQRRKSNCIFCIVYHCISLYIIFVYHFFRPPEAPNWLPLNLVTEIAITVKRASCFCPKSLPSCVSEELRLSYFDCYSQTCGCHCAESKV